MKEAGRSDGRRSVRKWRQPRRECSGGKSGLHGNRVPGNTRRGKPAGQGFLRAGEPQGKRHRKQTAASLSFGRVRPARGGLKVQGAARVKGCGKSAPRPRQRGRHGKPHPEQGRIGTARPAVCRKAATAGQGVFPALPSGLAARGAWRHASQMNGHPPPPGGDRTRLTDRPESSALLPALAGGLLHCLLWQKTSGLQRDRMSRVKTGPLSASTHR